MSDVLAKICDDKRAHVAACKQRRPLAELTAAARAASPPRGFAARLSNAMSAGRYGLIAEFKRASPSQGPIRPGAGPGEVARAYALGGAACLSVLTDAPYFQGSDEDLILARAAVKLPALRKDFMLDPYQIVEARALGADCVLLIMAALDDGEARELERTAGDWNMDVLVEVHDAAELDRALRLNARLIGINNRNLKTLRVDIATTEALAPRVPEDRILVAESGLSSSADLARMAAAGARCFLIGESLMRAPDMEAATRALLASPSHAAVAAGA
ncbi:MAG: indole-3-glycerol phosphate synthase TrpC [Rhodospirillales bacterium]|nr:indole-3-glycerol phosphate synthase TrpC [Rhodospirillales bacterium]